MNNTSALRLEYPTVGSVPNLIGGFTSNSVGVGAEGVVIAGGGSIGNINSIGADSDYSVIGGGQANTIASSVFYATIAGGGRTSISTNCFASTIGGGFDNNISADSPYATIAGGELNVIRANSRGSTVSGGINHFVLDNSECATIAGGKLNDIRTDSDFSTVSGGFDNNIGTNASFSVILGGDRNGIGNNAQAALAAGRLANANHTGTFVWADSQIATFASTGTNQFLIRASGGVGIGTGSPEGDLHVRGSSSTGSFILTPNVSDSRSQILLSENTTASFGMILRYEGDRSNNPLHFIGLSSDVESSPILTIERSGANVGIGVTNPVSRLQVNGTVTATAFNPSSDRNLKENFHAMDPQQVLEKVVALPISRWNFIGDASTPHVGPMAQDFHAAFGLGTDERHIATVDADGVALAAIQGLNQKLAEKDTKIKELEQRLAIIEALLQK